MKKPKRQLLRDVLLDDEAWRATCYGEADPNPPPLVRSIRLLLARPVGRRRRPTVSELRSGYFVDESLPHAALGGSSGDQRRFAAAWWHDYRGATYESLAEALGLSKRRVREVVDEGRVLIRREEKRRLWASTSTPGPRDVALPS